MRILGFGRFAAAKGLLGAAALVLGGLAAAPAHANAVFEFDEVSGNVVATLSGSLDLPQAGGGLEPPDGGVVLEPQPAVIDIENNPGKMNFYSITGPTSFGANNIFGTSLATTNTDIDLNGLVGELLIPAAMSGVALSGTATWLNQTFASMGLDLGTYVYTLSNDGGRTFTGDTLTVQIGEVPLPAGLSLLASGLAALGGLAWWRRRKSVPPAFGLADASLNLGPAHVAA